MSARVTPVPVKEKRLSEAPGTIRVFSRCCGLAFRIRYHSGPDQSNRKPLAEFYYAEAYFPIERWVDREQHID
jgi:hypothetical protein